MCEPRAPYGSIKTGPLAQKVESSIDPNQAAGSIRIVVDVFPRPDLRDELLDEVTALYSEFLESLHQMRSGSEITAILHDKQAT